MHIGLPEQAVGRFPLGSGLVVEDRPSELSCESTQNVKIFNTAMSRTFISSQYLTQQIETNLDLSRSR